MDSFIAAFEVVVLTAIALPLAAQLVFEISDVVGTHRVSTVPAVARDVRAKIRIARNKREPQPVTVEPLRLAA